jgi:flagellar biosynthesis protein FlhG
MGRTDKAAEAVPMIVAVGGGKGGVGKSVIALNLALAMAKLGARVTAVDADLGSANLHTMLGIDHPGQTLQALLDGRVDSLNEVSIASGYPNLSLVPGSVAVPGAANLQHARKQKLVRNIGRLDADVVVIDCGAGVNFNVVDFFAAADMQFLVATPQLVSLQNAYGFLKAALYRVLHQRAKDGDKGELFEQASDQSEVESVRQLLERIAPRDASLAADLRNVLASSQYALIGNMLVEAKELNALHALSRMINDFLTLKVPVLGGLLRRDRIHNAVSRRRPFVIEGGDPESKLLMQLAEACLNRQRTAANPAPPAADTGGRPDPFDRAASSTAVPLPAALSHYERAHERHRVEWPATIELAGLRQAGRVLDVSGGGMKLELRRPCTAGAHLRVALPQKAELGLFTLRVIHVSGFIVGCIYDPEPSRSALAALLERARSAPAP